MPVSGGPYLIAALFCDRVLQEKHDDVFSAIRLVDRWNISGQTTEMPQSIVQTNLLVLFKSGSYRGSGQLTLTPITPRNDRLASITFPLRFDGDDERGTGVAVPFGYTVNEEGLYWFEVSLALHNLAPNLVTCIPMRVAYIHLPPRPATGQ